MFFVPYLLPEDDDQLFAFFRNSEAINTIFPSCTPSRDWSC
ncbi:hypothetical protein FLP41_13095 [Paracoccus marcusii]|nr:hypothetical protein FLP41_13095 [Paracoccus marcusii]